MKKRLPIILLMVTVSLFVICYCVNGEEGKAVSLSDPSVSAPHIHLSAAQEQTVDDPVQGFCGNTITTIVKDGKEYTFWGGDSVSLTAILINLDYSEMEVCKCPARYKAKIEFGRNYDINLSESFVRSENGQAALTEEQVATIKAIIDRL